jgi:site-specific DNA-methyltransferase (adenine-specific)
MRAFRTFLHGSDMMAYLAMMAPRLVELRRVLKETGSIYLHCDPTASHYLKILMDAVFGPFFFKNEIVWKRSDAHSDAKQGAKHFGRIHDILLFFSKGAEPGFNSIYNPLPESTKEKWYRHVEEGTGRRYNKADVTGPGGAAKGNAHYDWKGITRYWRYKKSRMEELEARGRLVYSKSGMVYEKRYLDESKGVPAQDIWDDIPMLRGLNANRERQERLGYPTQKPEALLERIVRASSNEGDLILDPFCGCGTTIQVAQRLNRRWIGIDITHLAIGLIKKRLSDTFGDEIRNTYTVIGEPTDHAGAAQLAAEDKYQFQWWALGLVGARPAEQKKGADRGIDGRLYFHDDASGNSKQILFSVKAGGVNVTQIRDLRGTLEREKAEIGVFLCFEEPTRPMLREAAEAGFYQSSDESRYPRIQIFTIEELLGGKHVEYPAHRRESTFKRAPRHREAPAQNLQLPLNE